MNSAFICPYQTVADQRLSSSFSPSSSGVIISLFLALKTKTTTKTANSHTTVIFSRIISSLGKAAFCLSRCSRKRLCLELQESPPYPTLIHNQISNFFIYFLPLEEQTYRFVHTVQSEQLGCLPAVDCELIVNVCFQDTVY